MVAYNIGANGKVPRTKKTRLGTMQTMENLIILKT